MFWLSGIRRDASAFNAPQHYPQTITIAAPKQQCFDGGGSKWMRGNEWEEMNERKWMRGNECNCWQIVNSSKVIGWEQQTGLHGGEDPQDAWSRESLSEKEPSIIGIFWRKWPIRIRHPMGLHQPVIWECRSRLKRNCIARERRCFGTYRTYACVMLRTCMSHVTHMHESCVLHEWVISHWTAISKICGCSIVNTRYIRVYMYIYIYIRMYIYICMYIYM